MFLSLASTLECKCLAILIAVQLCPCFKSCDLYSVVFLLTRLIKFSYSSTSFIFCFDFSNASVFLLIISPADASTKPLLCSVICNVSFTFQSVNRNVKLGSFTTVAF